MNNVKTSIPESINEEYYQISEDILSSFPKYRPPLDLFEFREEALALQPYARKGQRLSNEQIEELKELCKNGNLFVSRSDHPVYSKHIVKQLDLILLDANLKEKEIADILLQALTLRLEEFFEQPVMPIFEKLYRDIMVLTEYLSKDPYRVKSLLRRLYKTHSLVNHSVNCGFAGLWLYLKLREGSEIKRRELDRLALGLFLHDIGMVRVPSFIRTKSVPLTPEEKAKVVGHVQAGLATAHKLGLRFDELDQCISQHHERLDGSGYPQKLKADTLGKFGKIAAVTDSFCAMITDRPYADAMEPAEAALKLCREPKKYAEPLAKVFHTAFVTENF